MADDLYTAYPSGNGWAVWDHFDDQQVDSGLTDAQAPLAACPARRR